MTLVKLDSYYSDYKQSAFSEYDITNFKVIAKGDEKIGSVANIWVFRTWYASVAVYRIFR